MSNSDKDDTLLPDGSKSTSLHFVYKSNSLWSVSDMYDSNGGIILSVKFNNRYIVH